jgi:hypothetical protein
MTADEWMRHVECIGERRNAYKILVGAPSKKRGVGASGNAFLLDRKDLVVMACLHKSNGTFLTT